MILRLLSLCTIVCGVAVSRNNNADPITKYTVQMIGYSPSMHDDYVAVTREAIPGYIVGFEPFANADRVHHMLLYGCTAPAGETFWKGMSTCGRGASHILFAWARNAPKLSLPKGVGFSIGHETDGIKYFVLQVHYAQPFAGKVRDFSGVTLHISQSRPTNFAAVMLFVSGEPIPPRKTQHQNNISCLYESDTEIHPFAFRTHTHAMGRVVSAYYRHDNQWNKIGKRNPQWPQLFEAITSEPVIKQGDIMAASCRFDSHDKTVETPMGAMGTNEMCNFYMMFYYNSDDTNPFPMGAICAGQQAEMSSYPPEGFEQLPVHPELEHTAHQSIVPFGVIHEKSFNSFADLPLGQVSGLTFDNDGNLVVFHRAGRKWDATTFDQYNILLDKTPIAEDTILVVSFKNGQYNVLKKMGRNKFYLPHGIYVDSDGFLYTTDVGSHTVAKWKISGNDIVQLWERGEKLLPGVDSDHFCKPAGIVRNGDRIYVADGYCNSRIVEYSLDGKRLNEFGLPGNGQVQFSLPHDIVVNSKGNLLVSDRENGRVQEITTSGDFVEQFASGLFSNIYSASAHNEYIFMVPGRISHLDVNAAAQPIEVFVGRQDTGLLEYSFSSPNSTFRAPHVIRACPDGEHIFVGDIGEGAISLWVFKIQKEITGAMMHKTKIMTSSFTNTDSNYFTFSFVLLTFVAIVIFILHRRNRRDVNGSVSFDRKGFKPLKTEETVGFISEDSDSD